MDTLLFSDKSKAMFGERSNHLRAERQHLRVRSRVRTRFARHHAPVNRVGSLRFGESAIFPTATAVDIASVPAPCIGVRDEAAPAWIDSLDAIHQQERSAILGNVGPQRETRQTKNLFGFFPERSRSLTSRRNPPSHATKGQVRLSIKAVERSGGVRCALRVVFMGNESGRLDQISIRDNPICLAQPTFGIHRISLLHRGGAR